MQRVPAPLRFISPMECLEVDQIPEGELWQYELKLDGYRTIAIKQDGDVDLFSRNGNSFNAKFPFAVQMLQSVRVKRFHPGWRDCSPRSAWATFFCVITEH